MSAKVPFLFKWPFWPFPITPEVAPYVETRFWAKGLLSIIDALIIVGVLKLVSLAF